MKRRRCPVLFNNLFREKGKDKRYKTGFVGEKTGAGLERRKRVNQKTQSATRWSNNEGRGGGSSTNCLAFVLFGLCAREGRAA